METRARRGGGLAVELSADRAACAALRPSSALAFELSPPWPWGDSEPTELSLPCRYPGFLRNSQTS